MITVSKYKSAIKELSNKQKEILKTLYFNAPFKDTNEIAFVLNYKNFGAANLHIGTIGKKIAQCLDIKKLKTYAHTKGDKPAFYSIVHDYFEQGWDLQNNLREAIKNVLLEDGIEKNYHLSTEIPVSENHFFTEGKATYVLVNRYERDRNARGKCLETKGDTCLGCQIDFKKTYGSDIPPIIHVHHIKPLHKVNSEEEKNIAEDLVPLCPNCHAVVHATKTIMTIEELQARIKRNSSK